MEAAGGRFPWISQSQMNLWDTMKILLFQTLHRLKGLLYRTKIWTSSLSPWGVLCIHIRFSLYLCHPCDSGRENSRIWVHAISALSWTPNKSPQPLYSLERRVGLKQMSPFKGRESLREGKLAFEALTWVLVRLPYTSGKAGQLRWELACL